MSLDPDEDKRDPTQFDGLRHFVTNELEISEQTHFISVTIKNLAKRAQSLKMHRPARGLEFSLQQQGITNFDTNFIQAYLPIRNP